MELHNNQPDEMQFEDSENYRGSDNQSQSFGQIVLKHLNDCISAGSKEMTTGGVQRRIINGQIVEISVPNTKEIFINSVEMLHHLLCREFVRYKEYKERMIKIDNRLEEAEKEIFEEKKAQMEGVVLESRAKRNVFYDPEKLHNQVLKRYSFEEEEIKIQAAHLKLRTIISLIGEKLNYFKEKGEGHGID